MSTLLRANCDIEVTLTDIGVPNGDWEYRVDYGTEQSFYKTFEKALARFNASVEHSAICAGLLEGTE